MHIIYAMQEYPIKNTGCAGSGNYIRNIARIMSERGHEVEVVTEGQEEKIIDCEGIRVHILNIEKFFLDTGKPMTLQKKVIKNLFRSYRYNTEINHIHKKKRIDVIQYGAMYNLAFFRNKKIPAIIRLSEYPVLWRKAGSERIFDIEKALDEKRLDEELQIYTYGKVDKIIAPSYLLKTIVEARTNRKVDVIESPVCIDKSPAYYKRLDLDKNLQGKKYFFYYGGISARKEAHVIGEIIPRVLQMFPDYSFVIAGKCISIPFDVKKRSLLQIIDEYSEDIKRRCVYLGSIDDREKLFSVIANSEICVLPTRIDNLPNTVIESMGLEKVVVSTDCTSVEQLITDGDNGFLCSIDNAESLILKIQEAMQMTVEERIEMGRKARERLSTMQPDYVYDKMMEVYSNIR